MPQKQAVLDFMQGYAEAFHSFEPARIAPFYATPMTLIGKDGVQLIVDLESMAPSIDAVKQMLDAKGYARSEEPRFSVRLLDDNLAMVSSRWRRLDAQGNAIQDFGALYVLHRQNGGWKIRSAVLHRPETMLDLN